MHWNLDRTPESDDYWIGIYEKGAPNNEYLQYQWLKRTAQGSYYIGRLKTRPGKYLRERVDEFELRLFKGNQQCVGAQTNILRGDVWDAPTNPDSQISNFRDVKTKELDTEMHEVLASVQNLPSLKPTLLAPLPLERIVELWDIFKQYLQIQLFPELEQDFLDETIKNPEPKAFDCPEPNVTFPNLDTQFSILGLPNDFDRSEVPQRIVLSITLNYSYTYIYPIVNVTDAVPMKNAWMGIYRTQR